MNFESISTLTTVEADSEEKLPTRVHLLRVGKFKTTKYPRPIDITAQDMQEYVSNFKAGHGRAGAEGAKLGLPINYKHDKGANAAAWYNDMEFDGKDLWGTKLEWTGSGKRAILDKEYRCISSEFTPRCMGGTWSPPENSDIKVTNVFTGAALTNIPLFSGNHAISASTESNDSDVEQTIYISASQEEQTKERKMTLDEVRILDASSLTKEHKQVLANALVENELSTDEKKKFFGIEASAETPQTVEASAVTGSEGLVSVEASEIKALNDKVAAAESAKSDLEKRVEASETAINSFKSKEVEASVKTHVERGAIVASQADKWTEIILADASMEKVLADLPSNEIIASSAKGKDPEGEGGADAATILEAKVAEIQASNEGMEYGTALSQARKANPELAAAYDKSVTGE
jgi:predicted regulator of Ras-like GTPase activity (Roadblock/LC7/MglB family)